MPTKSLPLVMYVPCIFLELASKIGINHIQIRPAMSPTQIKLFKEHGEEIWGQIDKGRKQFERTDYLVM